MQRSVAHEISDELSKLRGHASRYDGAVICVPVQVAKRRKLNLAGLADDAVHHHRNAVACLDLGHPAPNPIAFVVHHLDAMGWGSLDLIAAMRLDRNDLLHTVHVE